MLAEINPLAVSDTGDLIAVDGKVSIDDNAVGRHPDILEYKNSLDEDELVKEARGSDFLYIPCDPEGNIAVMSNGSGMVMSCMDLISKQNMKVGVAFDLGGGATSERIAKAVEYSAVKQKNRYFVYQYIRWDHTLRRGGRRIEDRYGGTD